MGILVLLGVVFFGLIGWLSWGLSLRVYRARQKAGGKYASLLQVLTFVVSFLLISAGILLLLIYNIRIER